jgi:UPF0755 protein
VSRRDDEWIDVDMDVDDFDDPEGLHRELERGRRRRVVVLVTLLVVVPLVALGAIVGWFWVQIDPPGKAGAPVQVEIDKGWGVTEIGNALADHDVVNSSLVFQAYARLKGAGPFDAGRYTLRKHMGVKAAINVLDAGPHIRTVNLAIIPGQRLAEIAATIDRKVPWLNGDKFLQLARSGAVRSDFEPAGVNNLEGLLWPDTYRVDENENEQQLLNVMVRQFNKQATAAGLSTGSKVNGLGAYDIVKVASLIQSEAKVDRDRPLIASVVYNRVKINMKLQIDATVLYALRRRSGLTRADLQTNSPYNTYVVHGLPPTPIAGITTASLQGALHPATTTYLYYVLAGKDGHHAFASTLQEHEVNIAKARAAGLL